MRSQQILLEIVPYLQKTQQFHKLLYKKNASTWIPRARRPTMSQGLSDAVFRVKSSGKLIVLRLPDTRVDASTWNSSTDRGQLIEECHIKQARAKLMCSKKEGDCLGKTHTKHTHTETTTEGAVKDDSGRGVKGGAGEGWADDKRQTLNTKRETRAKTLARNDSNKMQDGFSAYSSIFQLYQQKQAAYKQEKSQQQMTVPLAKVCKQQQQWMKDWQRRRRRRSKRRRPCAHLKPCEEEVRADSANMLLLFYWKSFFSPQGQLGHIRIHIHDMHTPPHSSFLLASTHHSLTHSASGRFELRAASNSTLQYALGRMEKWATGLK